MPADPSPNQIRLTRVYPAPARAVWDAWTTAGQAERWWGPRGFTVTTHGREMHAGGAWRFTMHGPDGTDYPNVVRWRVVEPLARLVYEHGSSDDGPAHFGVEAVFTEAVGHTTLVLTFTLATPEAAAAMARRVKQFGGNATWDRLAEHLADHLHEAATGRPCFVIQRTLAAPIERVFAAWVEPDRLARWLPPPGMAMRFLRPAIEAGQSALFVIEAGDMAMHVRAGYRAIEPPRRIVYTQQFVDAQEQPAPAPGAPVWPAVMLNTVLLAEEGDGSTRVTLMSTIEGDATAAETEAFVQERAGMTLGWTASFDALESMLAAAA